jgi:hypothetical protein
MKEQLQLTGPQLVVRRGSQAANRLSLRDLVAVP